MSNMSRGRKDWGPRAKPKPKTTQGTVDKVLPGVAGIRAQGKKNVEAATKAVNQGKDKAALGPTKKRAAAMRRAEQRKQAGAALAKASSDMAEQSAAAQARFSAEHDQAASEASASHARMRQSTPGKAAGIIKRRRI
jgi:hypothetical protein